MNAIVIGPMVFAPEKFAAIVGVLVFLVATSILAWRMDRVISIWSSRALFFGLIAGRLGYVLLHWQTFSDEPLRAFAFWQGGFEPFAALGGIVLASLLTIRSARVGVAAAGALIVSLVIWGGLTELTRATMGQPAPTFTLQRLNGQPISVLENDGKPIVLNLWASWCPPCRREMPLLAESEARYRDVVFLLVNQGEGAEKIRTYLEREHLSFNHILLDPARRMSLHYAVPGMPVTLFLRPDGSLAKLHMGEISREALNAGIADISSP